MWAALVAGLAVLLVFGGAGVRRPFVGALAVLGAVIAGAGLLGAEVQQGSPLQPIIERGQTLLDPRLAQRDQSLQSRFSENGKALEAIEDNLLIGIGPGVRFGAFFDDDRGSGVFRRTPQLFLHNQYLYLLLIGGIPLLLAFVLYVLSAVRQALPRWRDPEVAALVVGIGSIMLSAVVMISFADPHMLITLALLTGAVVAAGRAQPDDDPAS
jgi:O-antigen ligase